MLYRCKQCGYEEARGWLQTVSCGVYLLFLLLAFLGVAMVALTWLGGSLPLARRPDASPPGRWWAWVIAIPATLLLGCAGAMALHYIMAFAEWATFARRRCPACGARRWSWGYSRGFGL